ncbi:MAG TPA: sigma-70 family RNA polymerase sigma factor [Chloroflexia bacterium]|nr:sigma-70 family RNA polymerase sigma factor [Chloroflexia bacterium]
MTMNPGAAASRLAWPFQDVMWDGLAGLRPDARRNTFAAPLGRRQEANRRAHPAPAATQEATDKREHMTSDRVDDNPALASQPSALTSAEQDRLDVQQSLAGNQAAFGALVQRYQSAVYNLAYRMLGDPTEAEDAAQEVFVRAWNQLHTFQQDRRFSTWLLSIASHHAIDMLRRRKPQAPLDDVALFIESDDPQPDELALRGEQREMVQRLLNRLPEKYRSVTVLRYYNDLSYDEIARATGLTESAVKTQLHRARRMLAELLTSAGAANSARGTMVKAEKGGAY